MSSRSPGAAHGPPTSTTDRSAGGGEAPPASPHEGGVALADTLGSGLLTVEGERHGAVLVAGNACVDDVVADYLIDLTVPDDAHCSL